MDMIVSKTMVPAVEVQPGDVVVHEGTARGVSWVGDKDHESFDVEVVVGRNEFATVTFATDGYAQVVKVHPEGTQPCGVCPVAEPGKVSWGCTCSMTPEEIAADAAEFARIHD